MINFNFLLIFLIINFNRVVQLIFENFIPFLQFIFKSLNLQIINFNLFSPLYFNQFIGFLKWATNFNYELFHYVIHLVIEYLFLQIFNYLHLIILMFKLKLDLSQLNQFFNDSNLLVYFRLIKSLLLIMGFLVIIFNLNVNSYFIINYFLLNFHFTIQIPILHSILQFIRFHLFTFNSIIQLLIPFNYYEYFIQVIFILKINLNLLKLHVLNQEQSFHDFFLHELFLDALINY